MLWQQQRDLRLSFRWPVYIWILTLFLGACKGDVLSESKSLIEFIQAIDPKNLLKINYDGQVPDHCSDMSKGIICDMLTLNITEIRLDNQNLDGIIDADSVCKLPSLRVLSLATNFIVGVIPESISTCLSLTYLNLSTNLLHGTVPSSLTTLKNLRRMDISSNNLTGPAPRFKQEIELIYPDTMESSMLNSTTYVTMQASDEKENEDMERKSRTSLVHFLPLLILLTFFGAFVFSTNKRFDSSINEKGGKEQVYTSQSEKTHTVSIEEDAENGGEPSDLAFFSDRYERFTMNDLLMSAADLRGQNFYSTLYKVTLMDTAIFAVKRLKKLQVPADDFRKKIRLIGKVKHPNLLPLVAYHSSEEDKLLIYRYQKKGSLSSLLSRYANRKRDLPWRQRLSIMTGIARGLAYIARELRADSAPHGNLKPSNILLSDADEPLISEYGVWGFLDPKRAFLYSSNGYRAPEKSLTKEADVFSFGVIVLVLLTGKLVEKDGVNLPKWVKSIVREEWTGEVFDREVNKVGRQWAFPLLNIALKCVSDLPEHRPEISEVLEKIEHVMYSQEDYSFSSPSSAESNHQDNSLIHSVIPERDETPGS